MQYQTDDEMKKSKQKEEILIKYLIERVKNYNFKKTHRYSRTDFLAFEEDILCATIELKTSTKNVSDYKKKFEKGFLIDQEKIYNLIKLSKLLDCRAHVFVLYADYDCLYQYKLSNKVITELDQQYNEYLKKEMFVLPHSDFEQKKMPLDCIRELKKLEESGESKENNFAEMIKKLNL
ncbi:MULTISPECIES: hypothetical protein [Psychrilyobacter]|uniref:Uncharacterized protein n=1 Tax=Psychrilyobacter piezotolerans TaxID=2293438 RepID=A0ABX9KJK1_9FUSO|nr:MULTISPECIES: hypothetical protein [Psychrilyobacter]MCS5422989.1 hypothetical protein [Psychrilyobacter sp. S5]NDI77339.1 hypothetical protein [Psychrilyobacter piezotolerans]RDE63387.1 hypothetical protein DV867_05820 [Psychrilyobacter sp. S5]REI41929.1 hypothetical protein DYH56_05820 [Psychrilyobacter piezotolerans]